MVSDNMEVNISDYIDSILVGMGGIGASLMAWKQGQKQVKSTHLDNVEKAIKIWEDTSTKLSDQLTGVESEMKVLKKNHEDCEESKRKLEERVKCLDGKICDLTEAMHNVIQTPKPKRKGYNSAKSDQ